MTDNIKATLATAGAVLACVACGFIFAAIGPVIVFGLMLSILLGLIIVLFWCVFKDAFDD